MPKSLLDSVLRRLGKEVDTVLANIVAMLVTLMALVSVASLIRGGADWLEKTISPMLALVFVLVCGLIWLFSLRGITPEAMRNDKGRIVPGFVIGLVGAAAMVWVYIFAVLSYLLMRLGAVEYFIASPPENALADLTDAYAWYFLDLIPLLDVNEALGWDPDVILTGGRRGFILLTFRILIVFQVFAIWKRVFAPGGEAPEAGKREQGAHQPVPP
jgi:hypothetical protein